MFDTAIVKEDDDRRGRAAAEVAALIRSGWESEHGGELQEILDEATAIETSLQQAQPGDLIVVFPADVQRTIRIIARYQDLLNPKPNYTVSSYSTQLGQPLSTPRLVEQPSWSNGKASEAVEELANRSESV
jgi:cyanophycin synthetase